MEHRGGANGHHRCGFGQKSAQVADAAHFQTEQASIGLVRGLNIVNLPATLRLRLQVLAAALNPLHRASQADSQGRSHDLFAYKGPFRAKRAADLGIEDVNLRAVDTQEAGQRLPGGIDGLRREPGAQFAAGRIKVKQTGARLQ